MLRTISAAVRLENDRLRRAFSALLIGSVVALLLLSAFLDQLSSRTGLAVADVGILFLLALLLDYVASLRLRVGLEVFPNEAAAAERQVEFIKDHGPKTVRMFEYSGYTVRHVFDALASSGGTKTLQILLADPRHAPPWHRNWRILPTIVDLGLRFSPRVDLKVEIRCYSVPASFRGRDYNGELIAVGWYTHDRRPGQPGDEQLWGAQNAVMLAPRAHPSGAALREMFDEVFAGVWATAVPVWEALEDEAEFRTAHEDWLRRVSGQPARHEPSAGGTVHG